MGAGVTEPWLSLYHFMNEGKNTTGENRQPGKGWDFFHLSLSVGAYKYSAGGSILGDRNILLLSHGGGGYTGVSLKRGAYKELAGIDIFSLFHHTPGAKFKGREF